MVNERYSKAMAETLHYLKGIRQNDIKKIPNKFTLHIDLGKILRYNYYKRSDSYEKII